MFVAVFPHQFDDGRQGIKQGTLTRLSNVGEKPTLDGIEFGAIRWIVSDSDLDADFMDQSLKILFEDVMPAVITTAGITPKHQRCIEFRHALASQLPRPHTGADLSRIKFRKIRPFAVLLIPGTTR